MMSTRRVSRASSALEFEVAKGGKSAQLHAGALVGCTSPLLWHFSDIPMCAENVWSWWQTGSESKLTRLTRNDMTLDCQVCTWLR